MKPDAGLKSELDAILGPARSQRAEPTEGPDDVLAEEPAALEPAV